MQDYPVFSSEPWDESCVEDYDRAKSDYDRRRMLIIFGCDEEHRSEAVRLFGEKT